MKDAEFPTITTGINLFNAATLIGTCALGRKYLVAGTAITLVGNTFVLKQVAFNNYSDAISFSLVKTLTGFLDLGAFSLARKGLRLFRAGSKFAGGSLMTFSGAWTAWRIGVDSLDIGGLLTVTDKPFGFTDLPAMFIVVLLQNKLSGACSKRQPKKVN